MAHFAEIDETGTVLRVIVVSNDDCKDAEGNESEEVGATFCTNLLGGTWKQTSYNNNMRVRYAGIGFTYNSELDAFIPPKPYPSWTLNEETADWDPPVARPTSGFWSWDELNQEWDEITEPAE